MTWRDFKDLASRSASDRVWHDKAFNIAKNQKHNGYQRGITLVVYRFFNNKSAGTSTHTGTGINFENQQLTKELHKPNIKTFKKRIVYLSLKNNFCRYAINK